MAIKKPQELLKEYYKDLESLTPEECARLHQYASDTKKEMEKISKVMTDMLLNVYSGNFPKIVNLRTASVVKGSDRAPKAISWQEVITNELPIDKDTFLAASHLNMKELRAVSAVTAAKMERSSWYQENKTPTSDYIKWSDPIRKIEK